MDRGRCYVLFIRVKSNTVGVSRDLAEGRRDEAGHVVTWYVDNAGLAEMDCSVRLALRRKVLQGGTRLHRLGERTKPALPGSERRAALGRPRPRGRGSDRDCGFPHARFERGNIA